MESPTPTTLQAVLDFISDLLWPATVLILVFLFRDQLSRVIENLQSAELPGVKLAVQQPAADAVPTATPESETEAEDQLGSSEDELDVNEPLVDERGFYTELGLKKVVLNSGLTSSGERFQSALLIFRTVKQRTWFVFTDKQVMCILDDANTRSKNRVVQWRQPISAARGVKAHTSGRGNPVVSVGNRRNWLYSTGLFGTPHELEDAIVSAAERAQE